MGWKLVLVPAYEADQAPPTQPPGIWPPDAVVRPPIYYPPVISGPPGPWPTPPIHLPPQGGAPGTPAHPIYNPPVISGPPGPWPTPPIHLPPSGGGGEGIWGPTDPRPQPPIYLPPTGGGGGEGPPGIWGPPGPWPTPPIAMPQPPVDPGYSPPWATPSPPLPVFDPDDIPDHPDTPDMNRGFWAVVESGGVTTRAFVMPDMPDISLPGYEPARPPEQSLPGDWVVVVFNRGAEWAWIPSTPPTQPHPEPPPGDGDHVDNTLPGDLDQRPKTAR